MGYRGCEVEKLWDISTIGKVEKSKDNVDILNSKKEKIFQKSQKTVVVLLNANAISTVYDTKLAITGLTKVDNEIKILVIIPAYNPGKKIIHCLNALGKNLEYFLKALNLHTKF